MRKIKIALLMTLLLTFSIGVTVFASEKKEVETQTEDIEAEEATEENVEEETVAPIEEVKIEEKGEVPFSGAVRNLRVTIPGIENINLTGDVEVFYTGENCDIFASLSKDNNYTLDLAVYDGEYELYQILYRGEEKYDFLCADKVVISGNAEMDLLVRDEEGFKNADKLNHGTITGYAKIGSIIASKEEKAQAEEQYKALEKEVEQIQLKNQQDELANSKTIKNHSNSNDIILISVAIAFLIIALALVIIIVLKRKNK